MWAPVILNRLYDLFVGVDDVGKALSNFYGTRRRHSTVMMGNEMGEVEGEMGSDALVHTTSKY